MQYLIQKKTPATNFYTIHKNISELETAKNMLVEFAQNYDADSERGGDSSISEDGLNMTVYECGDFHKFRIVEA